MSPEIRPRQHDADPFRELHDVLGNNARGSRRRFRAAHSFGNIIPDSQSIQPDTPSISDDRVDRSDENSQDPNLDYISDMDWGSSPGQSQLAGNPRPLPETKEPGTPPSRLELLGGRHDWTRILGYWPLVTTQREVELQLAEKQLAARFNPYNEMIQGVTIEPVERAPSPPPAVSIYPRSRNAFLANTADPVMPLSLIPTERIWKDGGRLEAGHNTAGSNAPLTGSCAAATGFNINNNGVGGPTTTTTTTTTPCGRPCQAEDDPLHGGICESTEHHPDSRVWVCDDHDKQGRHEATHDLRHLATSLRHYACADCCWKIEQDAGHYLGGMGWHIFEVPTLGAGIDPAAAVRIPWLNDAGGNSSSGSGRRRASSDGSSRHLARSVTRCACASKLVERRLCAPHRLEAMTQLHRWHPSVYDLEASTAASHARKNLAAAWAAMEDHRGTGTTTTTTTTTTEEGGTKPMPMPMPMGLTIGPSCPLCVRGMPVDHFGFQGPLGREGRAVAWVCKACLGVVTGVVASADWVEGAFTEQRWVQMGPLTRDYPMYPFYEDPDNGNMS
ncbi:hypothetical protein PG994_000588 [Apiospora phragmitis]|uniref:Uncharacterized protein n=1 Tax=Apiospora phragmitis TaxID=2905665 RepID=A0ABR1X6R3_9PEZI